jgi:histidinol-phosphate aminotransferase
VLQTLSKAYGMAGLRLGIGYSSTTIINILNKIKPPYNINIASQNLALQFLEDFETIKTQIKIIKMERHRLIDALKNNSSIVKVYPSEANFILMKVNDASDFYYHFHRHGIILRNRHGQKHCDNCIRLTIGTPQENEIFLKVLKSYHG